MDRVEPAPLLGLYRTMCLIAEFDRVADGAARDGAFPGGYAGEPGQEAVSAAFGLALAEQDVLYPGLHGIGDVLARGSAPRLVMAELFGKATGLNGGRGGRLHVADLSRKIMPVNGILAASVPLAAGCALAARLRSDGVVTVCFVGDRAADEGVFHETLNIIGLWNLPILVVAINNAPPGAILPLSEHLAIQSLGDLARVYGIETVVSDGMDAVAVYMQARALIASVREHQRPIFAEYLTDPTAGSQRDPILLLEATIARDDRLRHEDLGAIRDEVQAVVREALAFAQQSPPPERDAALGGVYREEE